MQCRLFYEISYLVSAKHSTFSVSDSISTVQTRTPNDESHKFDSDALFCP